MKRHPNPTLCITLIGSLLALLLCPPTGRTQASGFLQLNSIEVVLGNPTQIPFTDLGTGSSHYVVEFTTVLEGANPNDWSEVPEAVITPQGGGTFHATVPDLGSDSGFFRVCGLGGTIPVVTASFNSSAFEVTEGGMVAPVIEFSGPYYGIIRYAISGTASSGDYQSLSGMVNVAGTSAVIPVSIADNAILSQLKHLTLTLEAGPGIALDIPVMNGA